MLLDYRYPPPLTSLAFGLSALSLSPSSALLSLLLLFSPFLSRFTAHLTNFYSVRNSIGNNFALLEAKVVLSMLLQKYNCVKDPACKVPFGMEMPLALQVPEGHTMCLTRRDNATY